jgi:hypothetical protein
MGTFGSTPMIWLSASPHAELNWQTLVLTNTLLPQSALIPGSTECARKPYVSAKMEVNDELLECRYILSAIMYTFTFL